MSGDSFRACNVTELLLHTLFRANHLLACFALDVRPDQFTRIQFARIRGQQMNLKLAAFRRQELVHTLRCVNAHPIDNAIERRVLCCLHLIQELARRLRCRPAVADHAGGIDRRPDHRRSIRSEPRPRERQHQSAAAPPGSARYGSRTAGRLRSRRRGAECREVYCDPLLYDGRVLLVDAGLGSWGAQAAQAQDTPRAGQADLDSELPQNHGGDTMQCPIGKLEFELLWYGSGFWRGEKSLPQGCHTGVAE